MKKISLIIIVILFSLSCKGQLVKLSDTVSVNIPAGAKVLSRDEYSHYLTQKFNHSKLAQYQSSKVELRANKHFFVINNVTVMLVHGKRPITNKDNYLINTKKYFDGLYSMYRDDPSIKYSSVIKSVNDNTVLILSYTKENVGYYQFLCNDNSNSKALNGILQFDEGDKAEATDVLNKILDGIKFN